MLQVYCFPWLSPPLNLWLQTYGLAERLIREGNQLHMFVCECLVVQHGIRT